MANTVGSGAVTIPLMKKAGYKPEFAGAAEAAASTGGQIMPPIMGAAAFLMADYVQLPYGQIALKAVLPALLYFTGIFISVHLEAKKVGLKGLPKEELPKLKPLLKKSYLLLPLVLLIYLVSTSQKSIQYAAALSIVACIVVTLFSRETRITPMRLLEALAAGGQGSIHCGCRLWHCRHHCRYHYHDRPGQCDHQRYCGPGGRQRADRPVPDHDLLHRSGHGCPHHRNLLHYGSHLRPHSGPHGRSSGCGPLLRILFWHRGRSDPAGGSGRLCPVLPLPRQTP